MSTSIIIFSIAIVVLSVLLVVIVAAQTNRGEGLGGAVTGQSNFYNNSKKDGKDAFLKKLTIIIGIIFVVLVAVVDVLVARGIIK